MNFFSLVIPIYNEAGNILPLVKELADYRKASGGDCPAELILVNNGSLDNSGAELREAASRLSWIRIIELKVNDGYGGGIQEGFRAISPSATHVGWIPGDRQYSIADLGQIWNACVKEPASIHKGIRVRRMDGTQMQFVSNIYSRLVQKILQLPVKDVNGLPKIFPVGVVTELNVSLAKNFQMDYEILTLAHARGISIREHPVIFYARRVGVSSWSSKRIRVYVETLSALLRFRARLNDRKS